MKLITTFIKIYWIIDQVWYPNLLTGYQLDRGLLECLEKPNDYIINLEVYISSMINFRYCFLVIIS